MLTSKSQLVKFALENYIQDHPSYGRLYKTVQTNKFYDELLMNLMLGYVENFCDFRGISFKELENLYTSFVNKYNKHLEYFESSGNYPYLNDKDNIEVSSLEYEVALLFSPLISVHRYKIMQCVYSAKKEVNNLLFIGAGPGLEIEILNDSAKNIAVIETSPSDFFSEMHPDCKLYDIGSEELTNEKFDRVYAIELLEHVEDPYGLVRDVESMLPKSGEFIVTTATDIPQFDHLANFDRNPVVFINEVNNLGFRVTYLEDIPHYNFFSKTHSCNTFFILVKE